MFKSRSAASQSYTSSLDEQPKVEVIKPIFNSEEVVSTNLLSDSGQKEISIDHIIKNWEPFLQSIKRKLVSTYALMREVKPVSLEKGILRVYLNENLRILKQAIENEDNMSHIVSSFQEVFLVTVKVVIIDEIIDNSEEAKIIDYFSSVVKSSNIVVK